MASAPARGVFRSLGNYNFRMWSAGAIVSNVGTWMQRTAQDWLVLTGLTHHNAGAVGIVMSLQFGPQMLLLAVTGLAADRIDRRKLLFVTQVLMGALAFGLGVLTLSGHVRLWQVYAFALMHGCVTAFDTPARQTFVADLVGDGDLSNAVALNSTSFNAARMIGPAVAGLLIAKVGTGWVFVLNGLSFLGVLASLAMLRVDQLHRRERSGRARGGFVEGFRYVWQRPDLKAALIVIFLIGTFGLNFPIFISTMAVTAFHSAADQYGLLSSMMAIGSVSGALLAARRGAPRMSLLFGSSAVFGIGCALAACMPSYLLFGIALIVVGIAAQTVTNSTNSYLQLSTEPGMRGRVIAVYLAVALGGTPLGAPLVGWIADNLGPRWALGVGALSGFAGALVGLAWLVRYRGLRIDVDAARVRIRYTKPFTDRFTHNVAQRDTAGR